MTPQQIQEALTLYRQILKAHEIEPVAYPHDDLIPLTDKRNVLPHCSWMIEAIPAILADGDTEKAGRWLCFIQGCLWTNGMYTITDLKNHNRPNAPEQ